MVRVRIGVCMCVGVSGAYVLMGRELIEEVSRSSGQR